MERSQFRELFSFYRFKLSGSIISDKKERISVENATFVAMKNLSLFLLLCLLFAACAKDENKEPILVTDIVMPTQTSFNPGDKVTIKAQGFQTDDDIMFEIY